MASKTLYAVLGVRRDASRERIRTAYLRRVKELHPDQAGEESAEAFREVHRAYAALSDPDERRRYDRQLDTTPAPVRRARAPADRATVEPLVPEPGGFSQRRSRRHAGAEDLVGRTPWSNPRGVGPAVASSEPVDLTVTLAPDDAARGGTFGIAVPVQRACWACGGAGSSLMFPCLYCRGRGWVVSERSVRLELPPGLRSGTVLHLTYDDGGLDTSTIRIRVLVRPAR